MKYLVVIALFLSSCTISVVDKRLPREEVQAAFGERDKVLEGYAKLLNSHQERLNKLDPPKEGKK